MRLDCLSVILASASMYMQASAAAVSERPLTPREVLFGVPVRDQPQISPDGTRLAYLTASAEGIQNLYVKSLAAADDRQITADTKRPVSLYRWAEDSRRLLYFQDSDGDENFHLYAIHIETREVRDLTPFAGAKATNLQTHPRWPGEILISVNARDPATFDSYRIQLQTGKAELEAINPGDVLSWTPDDDFAIRAATAFDPLTGATILRTRKSVRDPWRDIVTWKFHDGLMFGQINGGSVISGFAPDGRSLYVVSTNDHDTGRLVRIDQDTGRQLEVIAQHPLSDVALDPTLVDDGDRALVLKDPRTQRIQAVGFQYTQWEWQAVDEQTKADLDVLRRHGIEFPLVTSRSTDDTLWVVKQIVAAGPTQFHLYDRERKAVSALFYDRPALLDRALGKVRSVVIQARDGLKLVSYLTSPQDDRLANAKGVPPMVVHIHGGPWWRDSWGFDPVSHLLADRGYAVLQVNYRGSTGFGKAFLNAGNHQLGRAMQDDITDVVKWAIENGFADPKRIAVMGYSAGGYATLRALTRTPELYACGIDIVGPSDVGLFMSFDPPWWKIVKTRWRMRIGDAENDAALNRSISPLYEVDKIRAPLMVVQGANDVRVTKQNSDVLVAALRKRGLPVSYVVYPDEGHAFVRPENNLDLFGRIEEFLATALGGGAEPWRAVPGSSAQLH